MIDKKRSTFYRQDFTEKELRRSGAFGSWVVAYSTIKALDNFAKENQYDNIDDYLIEVKKELKEEPESDAPMMVLDDFSSYYKQSNSYLETKKKVTVST